MLDWNWNWKRNDVGLEVVTTSHSDRWITISQRGAGLEVLPVYIDEETRAIPSMETPGEISGRPSTLISPGSRTR